MCWFGYITDRHVVKEDMKVFKMLYREEDSWKNFDKDFVRTYKPPFYGGIYKLGEMREVNGLGIFPTPNLYDYSEYEKPKKYKIEEGLHCYSLEKCKRTWDALHVKIINKSNLFAKEIILQTYPREGYNIIVKTVLCIIPKGTVYWENQYGEIVTEKLVPIKEL